MTKPTVPSGVPPAEIPVPAWHRSRGTSWQKLIARMVGASRKGYAVRVQVFIDGEWRYLGQRRPHHGR